MIPLKKLERLLGHYEDDFGASSQYTLFHTYKKDGKSIRVDEIDIHPFGDLDYRQALENAAIELGLISPFVDDKYEFDDCPPVINGFRLVLTNSREDLDRNRRKVFCENLREVVGYVDREGLYQKNDCYLCDKIAVRRVRTVRKGQGIEKGCENLILESDDFELLERLCYMSGVDYDNSRVEVI